MHDSRELTPVGVLQLCYFFVAVVLFVIAAFLSVEGPRISGGADGFAIAGGMALVVSVWIIKGPAASPTTTQLDKT